MMTSFLYMQVHFSRPSSLIRFNLTGELKCRFPSRPPDKYTHQIIFPLAVIPSPCETCQLFSNGSDTIRALDRGRICPIEYKLLNSLNRSIYYISDHLSRYARSVLRVHSHLPAEPTATWYGIILALCKVHPLWLFEIRSVEFKTDFFPCDFPVFIRFLHILQ